MQTKLHHWAVADPGRRFDDLFNFVYDPATLIVAFDRVAGTPGPNGRAWTVSPSPTWSPASGCPSSWTSCETAQVRRVSPISGAGAQDSQTVER